MLETYSDLLTTTKNILSISGTTLDTQLLTEINYGRRFALRLMQEVGWAYRGSPQEETTVADQAEYDYLPTFRPPIEAAAYVLSGETREWPITIVESQDEWNRRTLIEGSTKRSYLILPLSDTFKMFPTPGNAGDTIKLWMNPYDADLANADYTTGTVTLTNGSKTVTGSGTTFTAAMVGRWIKSDTEGVWYKIAAFVSTTEVTLKRKYVGTTTAGLAYTIGEVPTLPHELHELLPHYGAGKYLGGQKKDTTLGQEHLNFFYTGNFKVRPDQIKEEETIGGIIGALARYSGSSTGAIVEKLNNLDIPHEKWATTLTA